MSIQPENLIGWAEALVDEKPDCEVSVRASISRAYYASLHGAMQAFSIAGVQGASSHQAVIDALVSIARAPEQGRRHAGELAKLLPKLKRARVNADYRLGSAVRLSDAQHALVLAREIANACADAERLRSQ